MFLTSSDHCLFCFVLLSYFCWIPFCILAMSLQIGLLVSGRICIINFVLFFFDNPHPPLPRSIRLIIYFSMQASEQIQQKINNTKAIPATLSSLSSSTLKKNQKRKKKYLFRWAFLFNNETTFRTHKIVIIIFDIWSSTGRYQSANIKRILFKIKQPTTTTTTGSSSSSSRRRSGRRNRRPNEKTLVLESQGDARNQAELNIS